MKNFDTKWFREKQSSFLVCILMVSLTGVSTQGQVNLQPAAEDLSQNLKTQNGSQAEFGEMMPSAAGVNLDSVEVDSEGRPLALPPALGELARQKVLERNTAPDWVKELGEKTVGAYFPAVVTEKDVLPQEGVESLLADALRLHLYFESKNTSKEFKGFVKRKLRPFIRGLNAKNLLSPVRQGKISGAIADWTVETLVVLQQVGYLGRYPNSVKRTLGLMVGPHLKGASKMAGIIVLGSLAVYGASHFGLPGGSFTEYGYVALGAFGATALGGFRSGPVAAVWNASTAWFLRPTIEYISVLNARYFGKAEETTNHFYDWLKKSSAKPTAKQEERNHSPKIAKLKEDGTDFAGMTEEDQQKNWEKNLHMWVAVAKRFGQLLRGTHHDGRVLMMISWADEQTASNLVETSDSKLISLKIEAEMLSTPYKTALLIRGEKDKKENLEALFDKYQSLCERVWLDIALNESALENLVLQIEATRFELSVAGVSDRDLAILDRIQVKRTKAVGTLVTAIALNEIRYFGTAEANRNLEPEARVSQRAVRLGLGLQGYVEEYLPLVQHQIRLMGYRHSGKAQFQEKAEACKLVLGNLGK